MLGSNVPAEQGVVGKRLDCDQTATMSLVVDPAVGDCVNGDEDPFTVCVVISDVTPVGQAILGGQFYLSWDSSCIEPVAVDPVSSDFDDAQTTDLRSGELDFFGIDFNPVVADPVELACVTFQIVDGSCEPNLKFRPTGPTPDFLNKVSIPGLCGAIYHLPTGQMPPQTGSDGLTLLPGLDQSVDLRVDVEPPVFTDGCPLPTIEQGTDEDECFATVTVPIPLVTDDYDGEITDVCGDPAVPPCIACMRSDGLDCFADTYPPGCTTLTWTAKDTCGNEAECTQEVCVTDDQPPTMTCEEATQLRGRRRRVFLDAAGR